MRRTSISLKFPWYVCMKCRRQSNVVFSQILFFAVLTNGTAALSYSVYILKAQIYKRWIDQTKATISKDVFQDTSTKTQPKWRQLSAVLSVYIVLVLRFIKRLYHIYILLICIVFFKCKPCKSNSFPVCVHPYSFKSVCLSELSRKFWQKNPKCVFSLFSVLPVCVN